MNKIKGMNGTDKQTLPWWQKYTLTLNEASEYFGIGYKKLKQFVQEHADEDFVLWNGNRALIKREQFEKYMDDQMNVIRRKDFSKSSGQGSVRFQKDRQGEAFRCQGMADQIAAAG